MDTESIVQIDERMPWPEVEFLFGEDEEYQDLIAQIMRDITVSLSSATSSADSYRKYCNMVASTLKLDIEKSFTTKKYSPDEFQFLLSKHSEQVEIYFFFFLIIIFSFYFKNLDTIHEFNDNRKTCLHI